MSLGPNIVVYSGLLIGLVFGAVGLLSGFCLMSSLRDWWTANDGRKVRSYAVALAVAILGTQWIAGAGLVDIAKSLYLQPSFSAPLRNWNRPPPLPSPTCGSGHCCPPLARALYVNAP